MGTTRLAKRVGGGEGSRRKILRIVWDFAQSDGYPQREIGEAVGLATSTVFYHLSTCST